MTTVGISVVFTDLVGSTALGADLGAERAEEVRRAHFGVLRDAVHALGGHEVKNLGDGIMAVFQGASAALDAAVAMQQGIARHNQAVDGPLLAIRVGVATGDCSEEDGDYFGEPVIQAARLCAAAEGGEILATGVFRFLVPRDAHDLDDVGELDLKGLPEPIPTLRVGWSVSGLPAVDGPPLQARLTVEHLSELVGRDEERHVLDQALKEATAGERRVVLITGEAGLGKTRLTAEFACHAHGRGARVLYGRCDEELAVPYLPWIEALEHWVDHAGEQEIAALDDSCRLQLARLLPTLARRSTDAGEGASADQYALVGAVTRLLATLAAERPTVVVLDDLHWADDGTLLLLRQVATSLPDARLLLVGTYRDTDLGSDDALTETSARLHRVEGVQRMHLSGLSDLEVVALLEAVAGHEMDDDGVALAQSLRTDSAGNPFFVVEMLRHLAEDGAIAQGPDGRWTVVGSLDDLALPQSVRDVVGQRVRRLGPHAQPVLTAGAVAGREFDCAVVARAIDGDDDEVLDVLEEAMAAGLIAEVPESADRFTFTHALVQHTLYSDLSDSRRARMHRRVATAIEELVGDAPGSRVGELAKHWFAAVRPAELERAIGYALKAGERALGASAPEEAARWFARALDALDDTQREERCEVQLRLGEAERRAGRDTFRERLLDTARLAQDLGRDDLLVQAAIGNYRGLHALTGDVDSARVAVLEAALATPAGAEPANRARLLATLVGELSYSDDQRRFAMATEAADLARGLGDDDVLLDALGRVGSGINVPELLDVRDARTAEAETLTRSSSDPVRRFVALDRRIMVLTERGDVPAARHLSVQRAAIADEVGEPTLRWLAVLGSSQLDFIAGDVEAASLGAARSLELAVESGQPDGPVHFGALMMQVQWHRGQFEETLPLIAQALEQNPGLPAYRPVLALFHLHAGHLEEGRTLVEELTADDFSFPPDLLWMTSMVVAAEAVHLAGHPESAALLHERLSPFAHQVAVARATCQGPVSHVVGLLASTLGRTEEAEHHQRQALAVARHMESPFHQVRPMLALAELVQLADPVEAGALLAEASELVDRYGIGGVARQLQALGG